jgi:hypothetical protein
MPPWRGLQFLPTFATERRVMSPVLATCWGTSSNSPRNCEAANPCVALLLGGVWHALGDPVGWEDGPVLFTHHSMGMKHNSLAPPFSDIPLASVALIDGVWIVWAQKLGTAAVCPRFRSYRDGPAQLVSKRPPPGPLAREMALTQAVRH